jgi:hypothetical protein
MNAESLKPSSKSVPEAREETAHPAGPIPASLRFESDTLSFKPGERGQIAGVFYGYEEIPKRWKNKLASIRNPPRSCEKIPKITPTLPLPRQGGGNFINSKSLPSPRRG